ncbi:Catechol 1,2-dioxygenase [Grifola frondosa]|uniref:Catechol 1,2-dioxygenase n=1 Tax=Grifola frondosa TaxID=5627 RepID=A0A1C7MLX0_GRIFR|nr:Catechol 1,2-dioxygenase [Grifola frondosa]
MSTVPTLAGLAPPVSASLMMQLLSLVRNGVVMLTYDNPLVWAFARGWRNAQADFEGPFYMLGAPSRQIADGKAVLASKALLNQFSPFLFTFSVKDAKGDPVPHARFEWWQADSDGAYYFNTYTLRGTFTTDENGCAEAGEVRGADDTGIRVSQERRVDDGQGLREYASADERGKYDTGTERAECGRWGGVFWAARTGAEDEDMWRKVEWWNGRLGEEGVEKKIVAVGHVDFVLNQA